MRISKCATAHKKLAIGVLVILLGAGVVGVFASALEASSAHNIVPAGPGPFPGTASLSVQASAEWELPTIACANSHGEQELAPEVPGWQQVNSNGFGDPQTGEVSAVEAFNGHLYAGTHNAIAGARIFRSQEGVTWTAVTQPGFDIPHDTAPPAILDLAVFNGRLYASTGRGNAGQIWRTLNGVIWAPMVIAGFADPDTVDITALAEYGGKLYAGATNEVSGAQIWSSYSGDSNTWTKATAPVTGTAAGVTGLAAFDGALYAAVESDAPAQLWRSYGGGWTTVISDGFGSSLTTSTGGLAEFGGYLYVGAGNSADGAQLWRTNDGDIWAQAISPGFGDPNNQKVELVFVFQNQLYASVKNVGTGMELWRSTDGSLWERANQDGFGDSNNAKSNGSNATAEFLGQLYVGTSNVVTGGELWRMQQQPAPHTDLSIGKQRQGTGWVTSGERITYTLTITNAGPVAPITATVVDTWTPVTAVVGVDAPGCSVDLGGGVITCTRSSIGLGSVLLPDPSLVFTTSAAYWGTLTNVATVTTTGDIADTNLANNVSDPVVVALIEIDSHIVYLPLVLNGDLAPAESNIRP